MVYVLLLLCFITANGYSSLKPELLASLAVVPVDIVDSCEIQGQRTSGGEETAGWRAFRGTGGSGILRLAWPLSHRGPRRRRPGLLDS